jgi:hypothetical protein
VLKLNVCLERVAEASREDVHLVVLTEGLTAAKEGQELALVIGDEARALQLDEFTQSIAPERRPEALVDKPDKVIPGRCALVVFQQGIPLRTIACYIKCGEEHLTDRWRVLDQKKLVAAVKP